MGNKLWVVLVVAVGIALTVPNGRPKESLASFAPGAVQTAPTVQVPEPLKQSALPCILDSGLIAEELIAYEGPYVEDGTDEPVSDIAALMLYNSGSRDISSCMVAVTQGDRMLHFFVTWLPAGERALVLECDRAKYAKDPVTACRSEGVRWESFYPAGGSVQVAENGRVTLTVKNSSAQTVAGIRLRYKIYVEDGGFYLGGISYSAYVGDLASGESQTVDPTHYAAGAAKVVAVLTQ